MNRRIEFRKKVQGILDTFEPGTLDYNESDFWIIQPMYEYLEYYAVENELVNMAVALPLARGLHNGTYRKSSIVRDGAVFRLPYVYHCLSVCRMLADMLVPISKEDEDILLASALCHDMIEDVKFENHGLELTDKYHLDPRVYNTVKLVSKRKDFTEEEERAHFHGIESDPLALMVKLSDRGNNVEDMYNMSAWKVHEYVGETRDRMLPMCEYGLKHFPELAPALEILQNKIESLIEVSEILVDRYEDRQKELEAQLAELKEENARLRGIWKKLWEE
ncbi:MAG: HD domain-containing protein [Clostridiales bacterium]|nr:HD domain-containing protein [Candidatus Blautia equi]